VRNPSGGEAGSTRERSERHHRHTGDLRHTHHRDREQIERQTGEGDPRKDCSAHRKEQRLGRRRGHEHRAEHSRTPLRDRLFAKARWNTKTHEEFVFREVFAPIVVLRVLVMNRRDSRNDDQNREGGAERQDESRVRHRQRIGGDENRRHNGQGIQRRTALIDGTSAEVDHSHQRRAVDRCTVAHQTRVRDQGCNRRDHRAAAEPSGNPANCEQQPGQDGNVAARDRDHVIGACFLQPALNVLCQTGALADHDGGHDGGGPRLPRRDRLRDGASRKGAGGAHGLVEHAAALEDVDKRTALHRSDQARSPSREGALLVGNARIQVSRRSSQLHRQANKAAGAPFLQSIRGERSGDGDDDAARASRPISRA